MDTHLFDADLPDTTTSVCRSCGNRLPDPGACVVDPAGRHQPMPAPFAPGDHGQLTGDIGEYRRGRYRTYVRAGETAVVRSVHRDTQGRWHLRVKVRTQDYWTDPEGLHLTARGADTPAT